MLQQPPTIERRQDGWWIVVRQLGASYEFGPFPGPDSPACTMTIHDWSPFARRLPSNAGRWQRFKRFMRTPFRSTP